MQVEAIHRRRSGFADQEPRPDPVTILAFVETTIEPGYQRSGTKRCLVAIVANEQGRLETAELCDLTLRDKTETQRPCLDD